MTNTSAIRVLIVDDHGMVRKGLAAYLKNQAGLEVVGEARDGLEALKVCEDTAPDVVLMDLVMPELGGAAATRGIRARWPHVQVIALTSFQDKELVQDALRAGAIGYLLKNVTGDDLAEAIRAAYAGRSTLAPEAIQSLIQAEPAQAALGHDLTVREREVLALLVKGYTNPEIAGQLGVSTATARAHVSSILSKLGVAGRAEAIAVAIEHKLAH